MCQTMKTDAEVINDLGGASAVAEKLGVARPVVTNWLSRGISAQGRYQIKELAEQVKYTLPDDFMTRKKAA